MSELPDPLTDQLKAIAGLPTLVAEATATWRSRAEAEGVSGEDAGKPGWRSFEDSFPTFYEFTNRPR